MACLSPLARVRGRVSLLLLLLTAFVSVEAAPAWKILRAPRFTLLTTASDRAALAWAEDFNQFIDALGEVIQVNEHFLPPQTVVLFSRERDFRPYVPRRPDGKPGAFAGYFARRETWSVIGLTSGVTDEALRQTIFHEGVHWFMSASTARYPLWLSEGLAEVFSTFRIEKGQVRWGEAIPSHVQQLHGRPPLPLEKLIWVNRDNPMFNESSRTGLFYAQSWAFVHYLLFGQRDGARTALRDYLAASGSGEHPDVVFKTAFGEDYAGVDRQLRRYLQSGTYFVHRRPARPTDLGDAKFAPAPPAVVEASLARLALGSGQIVLATQHAERAVALAPDAAESWAALAAVEAESDAPREKRLETLRRALELDSSEVWCRTTLASLEMDAAQERGGLLPAEARRIANELERAINLRPVTPSAYLGLARVVGAVEKVTTHDLDFLRQGRLIFPDELAINLGLAELEYRLGNRTAAQQYLDEALGRPGELHPNLREHALNMRGHWRYQELGERVQALATEKRFLEAAAVIDEGLNETWPIPTRLALAKQRKEMFGYHELHRARDAVERGEHEEARTILGTLVGGEVGGPIVSREARRLLEWMAKRRERR